MTNVLRVHVLPLRYEWCDDCMTSSRIVCELLTNTGVTMKWMCLRCPPSDAPSPAPDGE